MLSLQKKRAEKADRKKRLKRKKASGNRWLWLLGKIAVIAVLVFLAFAFPFGIHISEGLAMSPSLQDGELCLIWRDHNVKKDDAVWYTAEKKGKKKSGFGRVIACAGERVSIEGGTLYVNGSEKTMFYEVPGSVQEHQIPQGCVFIMNEMCEDESDSRTYGDIPLENVEGAVMASLKVREF